MITAWRGTTVRLLAMGIVGLTLISGGLFLMGRGMIERAPVLGRALGETTQVLPSEIDKVYELPPIVSFSPSTSSNRTYQWEISDDRQSDYASMLARELSQYPGEFFEDIEIRRIYVVKNIKTPAGASALGFTDTLSREIYLNDIGDGRAETDLIRSTVHHEIAHLLMISEKGFGSLNDKYWGNLNGEFIYGASTSSAQLFPQPGFVSNYAMSSTAEDMAEVFAFAMTDGYRQELEKRLKSDDILAQKVDYISSALSRTSLERLPLE